MRKLAWEENYMGKIPAEELIRIVDGQPCHDMRPEECAHLIRHFQGEAVHCSSCGKRLEED